MGRWWEWENIIGWDVHDCERSTSVAYRGVRQWWRTRRGEGWVVRERSGEVWSCLTLVPVEGTIDSYPLYCAAYNASCTCCGYGRWHCVTTSYSRMTRAGSLDSLSLEGCRMLRLVGSIDEVPKVSSTVLDSGRYIVAVVGATVSISLMLRHTF